MLKKSIKFIAIIIAAAFAAIFLCFYKIDETEQAVVTQFGNPILERKKAGLYFKLPEPIQSIYKFDKRKIITESKTAEMLTGDKKNIVVNNYIIWEIIDPIEFYISIGNAEKAEQVLEDIVFSEIRSELAGYKVSEILYSKRSEITNNIVERSKNKMDIYGIKLVDVRIKNVDLPVQNEESVFERMRTERLKNANKYRAEGQEEYIKKEAIANKKVSEILSEARKKALEIQGQADSEVLDLYNNAFKYNFEFYEYITMLDAYKESITGETSLLLTTNSDLFRFFKFK